MRSFWFTFLAGGATIAPVTWFIGRHGVIGAGDLLVDWLDRLLADDVDVEYSAAGHPATGVDAREIYRPSGVTVLGPVERVR